MTTITDYSLNYDGSFKAPRLHWQMQLINEEPPAYELFVRFSLAVGRAREPGVVATATSRT